MMASGFGPVPAAVAVVVESKGRSLATTSVRIAAEGADKPAALATLSFAYLQG